MKNLKYTILLIVLFSCKKDLEINEELSFKITPDVVVANGSSISNAIITIPAETDEDKRTIKLTTSKGSFKENGEDEITVSDWELINDSLLETKVKIVAASTPGSAIVRLESLGEFLYDTIRMDSSLTCELEVSTTEFAVYVNFEGEIIVSTKLRNNDGGNATSGLIVLYNDVFKDDGLNVNGSFSDKVAQTNGNSIATTRYSPGFVEPEREIIIYACLSRDSINCFELINNGLCDNPVLRDSVIVFTKED